MTETENKRFIPHQGYPKRPPIWLDDAALQPKSLLEKLSAADIALLMLVPVGAVIIIGCFSLLLKELLT